MRQILFASSNRAKLEQLQFVADTLGFKVKIVSVYEEFPNIKPYGEEYKTQFEIVEHGAREIFAQTKQPIIVEDSILEVDALNGLPGLRSNDYLKDKGRAGLLKDLQGNANRGARMVSIVGCYNGKVFVSSKNVVEGHIANKESHKGGEPIWVGPTHHVYGGGFNAVFITQATGKTLADHSAKEGVEHGYREPNFKVMLDLLV